jgi:hypothetical protein
MKSDYLIFEINLFVNFGRDNIDDKLEEERQQANLVSNDEFNILTKRVDTMELSIGNLITRVLFDSILNMSILKQFLNLID